MVFRMKKIVLVFFIIISFSACGVETDSSASTKNTSGVDGSDTTGGTDNNTSGDGDGTDNTGGGTKNPTDVTPTGSNSGFDTKDALFDKNACTLESGYNVISDSSFDPLSTADIDSGVEINSAYPYTADLEATKVALFYPTLTKSLIGQFVNVYATQYYRFAFDKAWLGNSDKTIYVRPPKGNALYYGCYRFELNSLDAGTITSTKVFR